MFKNSNFEKILFSSPNISPLKILRTHGYRNKDLIRKKFLMLQINPLKDFLQVLHQWGIFASKK